MQTLSLLDNLNVLEIKTSAETSMDYIEQHFSLRVTSFSKYARGIEGLYKL